MTEISDLSGSRDKDPAISSNGQSKACLVSRLLTAHIHLYMVLVSHCICFTAWPIPGSLGLYVRTARLNLSSRIV